MYSLPWVFISHYSNRPNVSFIFTGKVQMCANGGQFQTGSDVNKNFIQDQDQDHRSQDQDQDHRSQDQDQDHRSQDQDQDHSSQDQDQDHRSQDQNQDHKSVLDGPRDQNPRTTSLQTGGCRAPLTPLRVTRDTVLTLRRQIASCSSLTTSFPSTSEHWKPLLQLSSRPTASPSCLQANENVKPSCRVFPVNSCSLTNVAMHSAMKSNNCNQPHDHWFRVQYNEALRWNRRRHFRRGRK